MKLGLVIDLDTCVGCHACAVACKQWNASGTTGPLTDTDPYGANPTGVWFNRVRHYEVDHYPNSKTVNAPMSCMHCEDAACVTVCPTGASYKREEDGIVLVDQSKCMGCNLCAWACPYGARELDEEQGVMKKCTLCVDRIYDEALPSEDRQPACVLTCPTHARFFGDLDDPDSEVSTLVRERGGQAMMPELGYAPVNRYLPPRNRPPAPVVEKTAPAGDGTTGLLSRWMNRQREAFESFGARRAAGEPSSSVGAGRAGARGGTSAHTPMRPGGIGGRGSFEGADEASGGGPRGGSEAGPGGGMGSGAHGAGTTDGTSR